MKHTILLFLFSGIVLSSIAQQLRQYNLLMTASSNDGNYIYLYDGDDLQDSVLLANTDHFIIKRALLPNELDSNTFNEIEKTVKNIGIAAKPTTTNELHAVLSSDAIKALKETYNLKTDMKLVEFIQHHSNPIDYFLFYPLVEVKMAIGQVYLDRNVKEGEAYLYEVYRVDKQHKEIYWGKTEVMGKSGNYRLPAFKLLPPLLTIRDSSIAIRWPLPINIDLDTIGKPAKRMGFDKEGLLYNTFFTPNSFRAKLSFAIDENWEDPVGQLFPEFNAKGDTLFFNFKKSCNPGSIVRAVLRLEDEVHNKGNVSDTMNAFMITKNNAPRISQLTIRDTVNGIALRWKPLPSSPYLSGVQIIRYGLEKIGDTLPILPITDSIYIDYNAKVGLNYRYEVRALYLPGMAVYQTMPANSFCTITKFSRPTPPFNLRAIYEGKNIRLNWDVAKDPTIDVFFVYRGTTPDHLRLLPARIKGITYLDTSRDLMGGSQYFYAVNCQNLKQDSSIYSNIVSIIPNRRVSIAPPRDIKFYYANGKLTVNWFDSRQIDNHVESFLVQKRQKDKGEYVTITPPFFEGVLITDTGIDKNITYQYRAASISFKKDTSDFSEIFEFQLPKGPVDMINHFELLNSAKGIVVSLPTVYYENRKQYNIFRKKTGEKGFSKIGFMDANHFQYLDKNVEDGVGYQYAVSITATDGREGFMGMFVGIKRQH